MDDLLILVDELDRPVGFSSKEEVHARGLLHRAFSIFIFNSKGELLLQQRAKTKYHSGGLWTNTCCGHPLKGEDLTEAATKRLIEEMNLNVTIEEICTFQYKAEFKNGLIENEIDHIFYGVTDNVPVGNPLEVDQWKYIPAKELKEDMKHNSENYTAWFRIAIEKKLLGDLIKK